MSGETQADLPPQLLGELCDELGVALNSLGGNDRPGLLEGFLGYSARLIGWAASGYVALKNLDRDDSSRLLIGPAIEARFKIQAVRRDPSLLYRLGYTEFSEQERWRGEDVWADGANP